jgi:hypothetical protein
MTGPLPAKALEGEMPVKAGVGAKTLRFATFDVQFPSDEFVTVKG